MAIEITVPRLGWSMEEGTFSEWLKKDGEFVNEGDELYVLESDKAAQEVESFDEGIIRIPPDGPKSGDLVQVGQLVAYLCEEGEQAPFETGNVTVISSAPNTTEQESVKPQDVPPVAGPAVRRLARELSVDLTDLIGTGPSGRISSADVRAAARPHGEPSGAQAGGKKSDGKPDPLPAKRTRSAGEGPRPRVSPRAARLAAEAGVNLAHVEGTGASGRIRERDVIAAAEKTPAGKDIGPHQIPPAKIAPPPAEQPQTKKISNLRRMIASRMLAASQNTAPVTFASKIDATNLVELRNEFRAASDTHSIEVPGYTDMFVKLSATALERHPEMRCQWSDDGLVVPEGIHVAVAVDTKDGLLVPVLRHVENRSLREVSRELRVLIERTRERKISPDDLTGGVFTVSSLGRHRVDAFTPILNVPQAAILGIGRIVKEPAVVGETITIREMVTLSLTFDHRIIDGAPAAVFLDTLCELVEHPAPWLLG